MPAPHPKEFRDDVVAIARRGEAPIAQIAKDFRISESWLRNWLHRADVEDGVRPGVTTAEAAEIRAAQAAQPPARAGERGAAPRSGLPVPGEPVAGTVPKMIYPLVRELAVDGVPVAVTCRVLGFSRQAFYAWDANPSVAGTGATRTWSTPSSTSTVMTRSIRLDRDVGAQQRGPNGGVAIGRAGCLGHRDGGGQPGVRLDDDVRFEPVLAALPGLVRVPGLGVHHRDHPIRCDPVGDPPPPVGPVRTLGRFHVLPGDQGQQCRPPQPAARRPPEWSQCPTPRAEPGRR